MTPFLVLDRLPDEAYAPEVEKADSDVRSARPVNPKTWARATAPTGSA